MKATRNQEIEPQWSVDIEHKNGGSDEMDRFSKKKPVENTRFLEEERYRK